jgi:hypothetical protein
MSVTFDNRSSRKFQTGAVAGSVMKQSPGYHSSAGPTVVSSPSLAGELPARSPDPGTGRAGASAPCSPSVDVVSSPRFGRGVAGAVPSSAGRAGASSSPDAFCFLDGKDVVSSPHLGGPVPARSLNLEASCAAEPCQPVPRDVGRGLAPRRGVHGPRSRKACLRLALQRLRLPLRGCAHDLAVGKVGAGAATSRSSNERYCFRVT